MEILKICENCGETYKPFSDKRNNQRFCCKRCREKKWAQENRERLCANVRAYRARRYKNNGKWLDNGKKAKENKEWMIELKSKPCVDCGMGQRRRRTIETVRKRKAGFNKPRRITTAST
jgi:hypothetical protein